MASASRTFALSIVISQMALICPLVSFKPLSLSIGGPAAFAFGKHSQAEKSEKSEKAEKSEAADKADKPDKAVKAEKAEKPDKSEKSDKKEKKEKKEKAKPKEKTKDENKDMKEKPITKKRKRGVTVAVTGVADAAATIDLNGKNDFSGAVVIPLQKIHE